MDFRKWVENTDRIDRLLSHLIDCHVNIVGLAQDLSLVTEADAKALPKSLMFSLRKRFGAAGQKFVKAAKDSWQDELDSPTSPVNWMSRGVKWVTSRKAEPKTPSPSPTPQEGSPNDKMDGLSNELQHLTMNGYHDNDPDWNTHYKSLMSRIHALGDETPQKAPPSNKATTNDAQDMIQKAKGAIGTLRDVLKDPKFEPILSHLEQEVGMMGKPNFYHNMGAGEQAWYNKLGDADRNDFDSQMSKSGDQTINHGDEWWDVAAQRAHKAADQGYQDADANWKWSAGYANRQRIRRNMNPEWEKELQGEALTPGGKMFREWLKKRVNEDIGSPDNASNVTAPTDPKVIAQRKAVNDLTSTMMKKNQRLKPGATDQQTVANLSASDPQLAKADKKVQQDVNSFFMKPEK